MIMRERTISFHTLLLIVSSVVWLASAVFSINHMVVTGDDVFHGWDILPASIFGIGGTISILVALIWTVSSGVLEKVWEWNPSIRIGGKTTIPRATIEKERK
jgi:hypothetical protein